jgi:predicted site-specific integrase-resolvase
METLKIDKTDLVTVTEFAKTQCVSRRTIYNWINEGKIKKEVISGIIFVKISSTKNL